MKKIGMLAVMVIALVFISGIGAFSSVTAPREAKIIIANDASAYLGLSHGSPSAYVKVAAGSGAIYIDMSPTNTEVIGEGPNPKATTVFDDLFAVTNQGDRKVYVWFESPDWPWQANAILTYLIDDKATSGNVLAQVVKDSSWKHSLKMLWTTGWNYADGTGVLAYVLLHPGNTVHIKVIVDTTGTYGRAGLDLSHTVIIRADVNAPNQVSP